MPQPRPIAGTDVSLAGEVQNLLFPKRSPCCGWCSIAMKNQMARVLGGDYFDFIEQDDGCQILFVGDVTGHGLHASVVMSLVYGFLHRATQGRCEPKEAVSDLNVLLNTFASRSVRLDHFFSTTLFFGVIQPDTLVMHYVNAGHPAGLVSRGDSLLSLPATSHPVGYFEAPEFKAAQFQFQAGDRLLLYTDGLTDSSNPTGEMFGPDRLREALRGAQSDPVAFLERLFAEVSEFQGRGSHLDDRTAIVIDLHGSAHRPQGEEPN